MQNQEPSTDSKQGAIQDDLRSRKPRKFFHSGISGKLRNRSGMISIAAIVVLFTLSYMVVRTSAKTEALNTLGTVSILKKQQLEDYFTGVKSRLVMIAGDPNTLEALEGFSYGYREIGNEVSSLPGAANFPEVNEQVEDFYETGVVDILNRRANADLTLDGILPVSQNSLLLQYLYIVNNSNPPGLKSKMKNSGDNSSYTRTHELFQKQFAGLKSFLGVDDILLIDGETGIVVYSIDKYLDFATDLNTGRGKNGPLAGIFHRAMGLSRGQVTISDVTLYQPGFMQPSMFIAVPLWSDELKAGVMVVQISSARIEKLLNRGGNTDNDFFTRSGEGYLVGPDYTLQTDDKRLIRSKAEFIGALNNTRIRKQELTMIDSLNTAVGLLSLPRSAFKQALLGFTDVVRFRDVTGEKVFASVAPLHLDGQKFFLVFQAESADIFHVSSVFLKWGLALVIILIIAVFALGTFAGRDFAARIITIREKLKLLVSGQFSDPVAVGSTDELGESAALLNDLSGRLHKILDYTGELSAGMDNTDFDSRGSDDRFAEVMNKLRESIVHARTGEEKRKAEDEIRNWSTEGIAKFNDLMRQDNDNIEKFTFNITRNLIDYLSVNQGFMFLVEDDENKEKVIRLTAAYAYDRRKYLQKEIRIGEGLLGNSVLEKQTVYLKEIPDDYLEINSGLGRAKPKSLLVVPLIFNNEVVGVFEFASFNEFKPYEIEFIEKIAENTANTLYSVRLNMRTKILLEESNERAEELSAQEEEMRQNLEELKATQEEMARIKEEEAEKDRKRREQEKVLLAEIKKKNDEFKEKQRLLEWENMMFNALMDSLPLRITFKDADSKYIRVNKNKITALGLKEESELIGKTDVDVFMDSKHSREALEEEKKVIQSGASAQNKEELIRFKDGRITWGSTTRTPLRGAEGKIAGCLVITWDITDQKNNLAELDLENKMLDSLTVNLPVLRYRLDDKGVIQYISGKGLESMGYTEKDLTGKDFPKLYPEAADILEKEFDESGFGFIQTGPGWEFSHILFANKTTDGGFTGIAFERGAAK